MMIRVIAGKAKNKKLLVQEGTTRPLTDRIKTSLFDLINDHIPNASVLDLFCGSGSFGIEALSRGAKHVTFVDNDSSVIQLLRINLQNTDLSQYSSVNMQSATNFLAHNTNKYDIIFIDPPFKMPKIEILSLIEPNISYHLSPDPLLIIRTVTSIQLPETIINGKSKLTKTYEKKYGKSKISFYR